MFLTTFMTQTDVNGYAELTKPSMSYHFILTICNRNNRYLHRGSMFILSEDQFGSLLKEGGFDKQKCSYDKPTRSWAARILDIGAGDGEVTQRLINAVHQLNDCENEQVQLQVFATEYSFTMRNRLQKKHFT